MAQADHANTAIRTLNTGAFGTSGPYPILAAHAEFLARLAAHPPRPIPMGVRSVDIENRADHLEMVFIALSSYLAVILPDTVQNVRGRVDLRDVEVVLADLASDVTGGLQNAADAMAGRFA